jgi:hypothetical protein
MVSRGTTRGGRANQLWKGLAAGVLLLAAAPLEAQEHDPWAKGSEWLQVRAGYAKSTVAGAADGNFGLGFGYERFRNAKWSFGAQASFDVLGRYGDAVEIESPWTVEALRHYRWKTPARPYVGIGGGAYYYKVSGTGDDHAGINPGVYLATGINTQVSTHGLLGFDVRMSWVQLAYQDNPVFGGAATVDEHQNRGMHWSVKGTYAWAF